MSRASLFGCSVGLDQPKMLTLHVCMYPTEECFTPPVKAEVNCILVQTVRRSDREHETWLCCISLYTESCYKPLCVLQPACCLISSGQQHPRSQKQDADDNCV